MAAQALSFSRSTSLKITGADVGSPSAMAVADVNEDGVPDLVVVGASSLVNVIVLGERGTALAVRSYAVSS